MSTIAVTGGFGYSGSHVSRRLLAAGHRVLTLTNSPRRPSELSHRLQVSPLEFDHLDSLTSTLEGCSTLVNTYWVRFDYGGFSHAQAESNTRVLFAAAKNAGVRRIVHVSITNPSIHSDLPYFAGKARIEQALTELGIAYSIVRPAVFFGGQDILINNIAWMLRRLPVFGVFGDGKYKIRPIHVEDFASIIVDECAASGDRTMDAVGPESFSFRELVSMLATAIGVRRPLVSVPRFLGYLVARIVGLFVRDVVLTHDEIAGLTANLLASDAPSMGSISLSDWAREHRQTLGVRYASELARRRDRSVRYGA